MSVSERPLPVHAPMSQFATADGQLMVGGITLQRLAARVGQTPFYAYERQLLISRVAELRAALPQTIKLHYAMKANPMPALVGVMAGLVDGIDVASGGELKVALDAGADMAEISFAGPGKRRGELAQAVAAGVLINIESFREVRELALISDELGLPARVAVRVNPDFELKGSGMKMGGGPKQFGVERGTGSRTTGRDRAYRTGFRGLSSFCRFAESACRIDLRGPAEILRTGAQAGG